VLLVLGRARPAFYRRAALFESRFSPAWIAAVERNAFAGFDLLVLDPGHDTVAIEQLPATVAAIRAAGTKWRTGAALAAVIQERSNRRRAALVGHAAQLVRAGVDLLWVASAGDGNARLAAAPLADRLRNELGVATCIESAGATLPDLDAAIAAGRADLVVVERLPTGARRA
jgi:hypothetical protein